MSGVIEDRTERIKRQIQALLSLSQSPNPEEAASAASKAQMLIEKYQIDIAAIESEHPDLQLPVGHIDVRLPGIIKSDWVIRLSHAIARANLCSVLFNKHSVTFIGRTDNVELATYMMNNLHVQLTNMVRDAVKEHTRKCKALGLSVIGGSNDHQVYRRSWLYGAALEIGKALNDGAENFESSNDGKAIVDTSAARIRSYIQMTWPRIHSFEKRGIRMNNEGYANGRKAGAGISVQVAVTAATSSSVRQLGG
jgi:hypothetical protein